MPIFLLLFLTFMLVSLSRGEVIDFHFGGLDQTGPAVLGSAGDVWNRTTVTNGGPVTLKNVDGDATTVTASWTSGDAWGATKTVASITTNTSMDASTSWLMRSCVTSYQYTSGSTNLVLSLSGLAPSEAYNLVLLSSGAQVNEGTRFTVTGTGTFTGTTTGLNRKLSAGAGVAYTVIQVVSSSQGTLKVNTYQNGGHYAVLTGFQLDSGSDDTITTAAAADTAPSTTTKAPSRSIAWGICGHPTWLDYANYVPANAATQVSYLQQLGCKYYRCSFEGTTYASILDIAVPKCQAGGITVLPVLPMTLNPASSSATTYSANYQTGYTWATYAISKGYALPYWELGNELENVGLISVSSDGSSPDNYTDTKPGGFVAIASGVKGAYEGIKDAYADGRASGATTITPKILFGATYRHWGMLTKIANYDGYLPCDMLSWHWYGPSYGGFNVAIANTASSSNGRTPVQCLADFKSKTDPSKPMDIWITETNRSVKTMTGSTASFYNGSIATNATSSSAQDWAAEAAAIKTNVDSFKAVPAVKGIFVYELIDTTKVYVGNERALTQDGYFGLVTALNGTLKTPFYTYQMEIKVGVQQ